MSIVLSGTSGITSTGTTTLDGAVVINESSADVDFRVESNGNANMLFVDGGNNRVGIGMNDPTASLDVDLGFIQVNTAGTASGRFGSSTYITTGADSDLVVQAVVSGAATTFYQGSVLAQTIDSTGAITAPKQPAFLAQPSSAQNDIAINATATIVFGTERFDQNADFASNAFTAPVSGRYQLNVNLYLTDLDHDTAYYQFQLNTSNRIYYFIQGTGGFDADQNFQQLGISILADMDASDTANVTLPNINAGAAQLNVGTGSSFSGYLAC